jgi:hypothetical protein
MFQAPASVSKKEAAREAGQTVPAALVFCLGNLPARGSSSGLSENSDDAI